MKTSVVKIFAGSEIRLAVLSFLLLGMAGVCMAQSSVAAARPAAQAAASVVTPQAQPAARPAPQAAQTGASGESTAKGNQEGIRVHGHWTIEVRNPDGTLAARREFENSINAYSGAQLVSAALTGGITMGGWQVALNNGVNFLEINTAGAVATYCQSLVINGGTTTTCSDTLTVTGPTLTGNAFNSTQTITFSGTAPVPQGFPSEILEVNTINYPCAATVSIADCLSTQANVAILGVGLTARQLDGLNGDPAALPVGAGQTVAVTVVISFS